VTPVILLTKADLCDEPAPYVTEAQAISAAVAVLTLNARSDDPLDPAGALVQARPDGGISSAPPALASQR
jgi:putative ribosome biogenesis GTPase RsgA